MSERPRLYLIDGYALIYRAFFAMIQRPLTTSRGENTTVAWGVMNFLIRLFDTYRPQYLAWVQDMGDSYRHETFPEYKATREKLDDALQEDFDRSLDRVEALLAGWRVPVLGVEGYEADDVIGTVAEHAVAEGIDAVIVSGDKDFYQLIGPHISLFNPGRRGPSAIDEQWVDERNAAARLGVPPALVVDYLALVGDSSDNVPGVKGVGDKTARQLIEQYGNLDHILAHASEISSQRVRSAVLAHKAEALLSRELVTIHRDVPVELDLLRLKTREPDHEALLKLLGELEFHSLMRRFEDAESRPAASVQVVEKSEYQTVESVEAIGPLVAAARSAPMVGIEVATSSPQALEADIVGLSVAASSERAWYVPLGHRAPDGALAAEEEPRNLPALNDAALGALAELLEDPGVAKAGHDIKDDWLALRRAGIELAGVQYDSLLASFLLNPGRRTHALEALVLERLGRSMPRYSDLVGKGKAGRPFAEVSVPAAAEYCCASSAMVLRLHESFRSELEEYQLTQLLDDVEVPLLSVLVEMEWRGIRINSEYLAELGAGFSQELTELMGRVYEQTGTEFNINSTPQLRHVLFEKLMLPVIKRTKTGPSTDSDVLEQLAALDHEIPRLILEYRELAKLKSTYVEALPACINARTGRIHTRFNQAGATTGRLSSSDPNLQNIPVRTARGELIRRGFVPADGYTFLVADYSQIELRLLAHLSGDPAFLEAFAKGGDIHVQTASVIFGVQPEDVTGAMRARAKTINFATIYGQGPFSLARQLGIAQGEAREFITAYFERFAGVRAWLDETVRKARQRGYVETIFGRRRYIPEIHDSNHNVRAFGERTATNSPLQGSAADLIKLAMIRIARALEDQKLDAAILLQVHDELVLEVERSSVEPVRKLVQYYMESVVSLGVPLVVSVGMGATWLDAKA